MEKNILLILGHPSENSFCKALLDVYQSGAESAPINSKKSFRIHLLVFLLATPAIWLGWELTGSTSSWHLWAIAAWTKVLQVHFLRAIVSKLESYQKLKLWISSKIHSDA